ncbi:MULTISPECIES: hypothetical protein [Nocardia]|uniref:hypothetical protein n=1 Tax=Nocardia abscessus TaxID=120957 RepID=UPI0018943263|nr:hypothetical protein [Nocardia abscessus]MBF6473722.1 hypothetical protein [Nocardia abscessus]
MSFFSTSVHGYEGITVRYRPQTQDAYGGLPARVSVSLNRSDSWLVLDIEDARSLLAQLPVVLTEHDAVEAAASSSDKAA